MVLHLVAGSKIAVTRIWWRMQTGRPRRPAPQTPRSRKIRQLLQYPHRQIRVILRSFARQRRNDVMMMRDMRSFGITCAIVTAMGVTTGCGGQPTDVGESDVEATIQQGEAKSKSGASSNKKSPFGRAPSLDPQSAGGTGNALPQNKLLPADGQPRDEFGVSVGIHGNTAVVGSIYDDDMGGDAGSAYVFVEDNGVWTQQAKLVAKDGKPNDYYGISVAIHGDRILVGAVQALNSTIRTGAVYAYERGLDKKWTLVQKIVPPPGGEAEDYFGYAVALEGNVAVIGAPQRDDIAFDSGAAYVFRHDGTQWVQQAKLGPDVAGAFSFFGGSVALHGTTALIGQWDDGSGSDMGSVSAFKETAGTWVLQEELVASDRDLGDTFGFSVAIYNNKAFVGAPFRDGDCANSGAVYVYGRYNDDWCEEQIIIPDDKNASQAFGSSVAVWGDMAAIGSYWDEDNGEYSGSAYAYRLLDGMWTQQFKYLPATPVIGQLFGISAAMDNDRVIIGANGDNTNGTDSGAAFQFSVLQDPNSPPPSPVLPEDPQSALADDDAAGVQCTLHARSTSSHSSWFIGLGLAALGLRRLSRNTRAFKVETG